RGHFATWESRGRTPTGTHRPRPAFFGRRSVNSFGCVPHVCNRIIASPGAKADHFPTRRLAARGLRLSPYPVQRHAGHALGKPPPAPEILGPADLFQHRP